MTPEELDALEARAKAATPGPWKTDAALVWSPSEVTTIAAASELRATPHVAYTAPAISAGNLATVLANAAHIAGLSPEVVLELVAGYRRGLAADAELSDWRTNCESYQAYGIACAAELEPDR